MATAASGPRAVDHAKEGFIARPGLDPSLAGAFIEVAERDQALRFTFHDLMRFHGPASPGGVAHAFKVFQRGLPVLCADAPCERREISVETSFGGLGARDAIEMITRAVTGERFSIVPSLARPELGRARERFVFRLAYRDRSVTLVLREGFVPDEFIELARVESRKASQEAKLDLMKLEMANRVMAADAADVYDAEEGRWSP